MRWKGGRRHRPPVLCCFRPPPPHTPKGGRGGLVQVENLMGRGCCPRGCVCGNPPPPPHMGVESDGPKLAPTTGTRFCGYPSRGRCYPDEVDAPLPTKCV